MQVVAELRPDERHCATRFRRRLIRAAVVGATVVLALGVTGLGEASGTSASRGAVTAQKESAVVRESAVVSGVRQTKVLGYSRQGRPIRAYEMGNPAAPFKALVVGSMHGYYEMAGETVVAGILRSSISSSVDLWVVPTMNPDGDALRRHGNANGVDLNRNWPQGWAYIPPDPTNYFDQHYSGPYPLSEPETRAMYVFLNWVHPRRMVSMHQPLAAVDATDGGARDIAFRNALSSKLGLPVNALTCWSVCHGSMTRWLTATQKGAAITVEFPAYETPAYLSGRAASGVLAALMVGIPTYVPPAPTMQSSLDKVTTSPGTVMVSGWAFDPRKSSTAVSVSVTVDGRTVRTVVANLARPDVDRDFRVAGAHGFTFPVLLHRGRYTICVTAHPAAGSSTPARRVGSCRDTTVPLAAMKGHVDSVTATSAAVRVVGWSLDPGHPTYAEYVRLFIDGRAVTTVHTSIVRADVNGNFGVTGQHGFVVTIHLHPGRYTLRVTALATATSSVPTVLNQREVDVPAA